MVTSFETIEHHDKHEEMMREIKRVLKPDGILIISSPNRLSYSDERNYSNPFHVKELYYDEFVNLLRKHFKYTKINGQRLGAGSFVFPLENTHQKSLKAYKGNLNDLNQQVCSLKSPIYFLAICSDEINKIQIPVDSIYIDEFDDLLKSYEAHWHQTAKTLQHYQSQIQQTQTQLEQSKSQQQQTQTQLEQSHSQQQQIQTQLEQSHSQQQQTQTQLEQSHSQLQQTQTQLQHSESQLQIVQAELEQARATIVTMETSIFWRLKKAHLKLKQAFSLEKYKSS